MAARFGKQPLVSTDDRPRSQPGQHHHASHPDAAGASRLDELVVHDLLNPMTSVLGQLELLEDQLDQELSQNDRQRLDECLTSARELSEMLVNLRCLAQIHAQLIPYRPISTCVQRLLHSLQQDSTWPDDGSVELATSADYSELYVRDCAALLKRALQILIQSAMRISKPRRVILDAAPTDGGCIRMSCRYVGTSLPNALIDVLWRPEAASLQREHGVRVDRARGLELAHHIVQFLGGTALYERTTDGGSFVVLIPETDAPASPQ